MKAELGPYLWDCACGCGEPVYERQYVYSGRTVKQRPRYLRYHACPPEEVRRDPHRFFRNEVPAEPIIRLLNQEKARRGMTWREMSHLLGYSARSASTWRYQKRFTKWRAERVLRRLAGLPTLPTHYEMSLARDPARERKRQDKQRQRARAS